MSPAPIVMADRTRKKNYRLTVSGKDCLLAEGDIGAPIYWRNDPPCSLKKKQPAHQLCWWCGGICISCTFQRGAQNSSVRPAYFHTNRLLIELYKQETEIRCRKTTATLKSKQTSIATVRYPILSVACFPTPPPFSLPTTFK